MTVVCQGITKTFGSGNTSVKALQGVDLEVKEGELLMIVGPSGSGKTTLISIIAGILEHDEGECFILGKNPKDFSVEERISFRGKHIGFVFQSFNLIPMLTSSENVSIPLIINGMEYNSALTSSNEFLKRIGMGDKLYSYPRELSGGQQQRVAIARGCIHDPDIIVCDEPTSSLDHETGKNVMNVLREFVLREKRSLIVVTHDARIFEFADRIVHLEDGKIVKEVRQNGS